MNFHVITAFPTMIVPVLEQSILKRSIKTDLIKVKVYDLRDFTHNKHRKIDARPYGGGPGMVLQAEPVLRAHKEAKGKKQKVLTVLLSPRGEQYDNEKAKKIIYNYKDLILICGHYEGIDSRVEEVLNPTKLSIGPFVLTGGELPALTIIDSMSRFMPGVLGNEQSLEENRIASDKVYTRPEKIKWKNETYPVPDILLTGHHKNIEKWRERQIKR